MSKSEDLAVFITKKNSTCDECKEELGNNSWITLNKEKGALCLSCADIDHLVFLPRGDAAVTRRSRKYTTLIAIVLKWSRSRKRYERQGLLVEEKAVEQAEQECLEDAELRARKRERAAERREVVDKVYMENFRKRVLELYPSCPAKKAKQIAEHACMKYSGRVGRSAEAKKLNEEAVDLAVIAHVRHAKTEYDKLLAKGYERSDARRMIRSELEEVLNEWRK